MNELEIIKASKECKVIKHKKGSTYLIMNVVHKKLKDSVLWDVEIHYMESVCSPSYIYTSCPHTYVRDVNGFKDFTVKES